MKKEILKTVMERIREKVPELRWVDADEGQLDFQDSRPPVAFPCCLVELSYPGAENMSACLLYTSPSPRDRQKSRMPSSA